MNLFVEVSGNEHTATSNHREFMNFRNFSIGSFHPLKGLYDIYIKDRHPQCTVDSHSRSKMVEEMHPAFGYFISYGFKSV